MNLHDLLDILRSSGRAVFTTDDLERITDLSRGSAAVYVHRMKERGMIFPIERGRFSISDDPFTVASQLIVPAYISFATGLSLHGRLDQVVNRIHMVSSRRRTPVTFGGMEIRFVRFPAGRVFGYRKHAKGGSSMMLGDMEKVVVDCLYMPRYCPVSTLADALEDGCDGALLERYAERMNSEAVIRRTGYLMEVLGRETTLRPRTDTPYRLNPSVRKKGKYEKRWKLYVNEVVP